MEAEGIDTRQLTPQQTVMRFAQKNRFNLIVYSAAAVLILFVYHLLSDGDFSFLMVRQLESVPQVRLTGFADFRRIHPTIGICIFSFQVAPDRQCRG